MPFESEFPFMGPNGHGPCMPFECDLLITGPRGYIPLDVTVSAREQMGTDSLCHLNVLSSSRDHVDIICHWMVTPSTRDPWATRRPWNVFLCSPDGHLLLLGKFKMGDPPWCASCRLPTQTMQKSTGQTELMDETTSGYLIEISRQPLLSAREMNDVLELALRFPESKKLAVLAATAESGRQELGRLTAYVNDSWFHRSLLSATILTEEALRNVREMDVSQLNANDPIGRKFHQRVKDWYDGGKQPIGLAGGASLKRKKDDTAEADDTKMTAEEVTDEAALESFLRSLRHEEVDYRNYMRDEVLTIANREAMRSLANLFPAPCRGRAIEVTGVHFNVPKEAILAMAELASYTRKLPIDLTALAANLQSGDARSYMQGNLCSYLFPLERMCDFEHGASPFGVRDIHPQATLITDTKLANVKGEGFATPVYPTLVVTPIDDSHTVLEGAIIRGIRAEEGAFENSVGLAKSETLTGLSPLLDTNDFDVHFHIASLFKV